MFRHTYSDMPRTTLTRSRRDLGPTAARAPSMLIAVAGIALIPWSAALAQIDTGPSAQRVPWRPAPAPGAAFDPLNSVVEITAPTGGGFVRVGTGSIIDKRPDADPAFAWYCVLTADHVANPAGTIGPASIGFGDVAAQGSFGGASNIVRRAPLPVAMGGMGVPVDLAVIGIRAPKSMFMEQVVNLAMLPTTQAQAQSRPFTQPGYGGTGDFVAADPLGTPPTPAGMSSLGIDHRKRFQNNVITGPTLAEYEANGQAYSYGSIEWSFDAPAAPGPHGGPHPFLVAEGNSYGGDSGSPYLMSQSTTQYVGNFMRPGAGSDWDFAPMHMGDDMPLFSNVIFGVHAWGNEPAGGFPGGVVPYGTLNGGVPLTPANIAWISAQCSVVPAPGTVALLAGAGILAVRRRRA